MIILPTINEKPDPLILPKIVEESQSGGATPSPPPAHTTLIDVAAYWKFDDAGPTPWIDSIGHNDFAATGRVTPVTGALNGAAHSDGFFGAGYLLAADSAVLGAGPGVSFTYSLWVKVLPFSGTQDNLSGGRPLFAKMNTGIGALGEYCLNHDNSFGGLTFTARLGDNSAQVGVNAGPLSTPPQTDYFASITGGDGLWHHIACGYDDALDQIWIQIDNGHRYTAACLGVRRNAAVPLTVFQFSDIGFGGFFAIDEMGLWKRRLIPGEVTLLFNGGTPKPLSTF